MPAGQLGHLERTKATNNAHARKTVGSRSEALIGWRRSLRSQRFNTEMLSAAGLTAEDTTWPQRQI